MRKTDLALTMFCCGVPAAFAFVTETRQLKRTITIELAATAVDENSITDHGDHGDAFHSFDALDEMYSAVAGVTGERKDPPDFEYEMLHSRAELDKIMHTKDFRSTLDTEDDGYNVRASNKVSASSDDVKDKIASHFEYAVLKQKKAQDDFMTSELAETHDDDHSVHHFELSLLDSHAALDKVMLNQLHEETQEKRLQIDDHMEKRGCPKAAHAIPPCTDQYDYVALKKKKTLNKLMTSKEFCHNLSVEKNAEDSDEDKPHFMSVIAKTTAALNSVMGGEAFRKSLESDASLGIVGIDGSYNVGLSPVKKTHNDIVSHFEEILPREAHQKSE